VPEPVPEPEEPAAEEWTNLPEPEQAPEPEQEPQPEVCHPPLHGILPALWACPKVALLIIISILPTHVEEQCLATDSRCASLPHRKQHIQKEVGLGAEWRRLVVRRRRRRRRLPCRSSQQRRPCR
jgi:hypothetical protein